ncbi:sensor histidine kinase [Croceitalea sp. P059]|uniref:sensor histidine kinase n=1 Tax=Croceitalea sp. P059 TaxID=3075601 RepID=UPI0028884E5F|nr:sensor histidine kinase [Croceitalea sp. P059]MDT0538860.1 sensor histidine kinase [Croceitalea sp. P059]
MIRQALKIILFLSLFPLTGIIAQDSSSNKNLELYYDQLRRLDIRSSKQYLKDLGKEKKILAQSLIDLCEGKNSLEAIKYIDESDIDNKILIQLIQGYSNYENENTPEAFHFFSNAIQLSDNHQRINALKFSLVSMLNLLRKQTFFSGQKYKPYLDHYEELVKDADDKRIVMIYKIGLESKDNDELKSKFQGYDIITHFDKLFYDVSEDTPLKARYYFETAAQLKLAKDFDRSIYRFKKAEEISQKQLINTYVYQSAIWQLSSVFLIQSEVDKAYVYWKKSTKLSSKLRNKWYNERLGSWIFRDMGKLDSAYYYLNESINTEFKFKGNQERFQSSLLSIENQTEKLKLDKLILDNRRKTNQNYLILAISLLAIGGITAILLQKNTTKKRLLAEQEALLKQERVDNLLKEQELVSIDAMIEGQEKERQRVANELHDDLGSLMATIKLHFDNSKVSKKDPGLQNAQKLLDQAYQKVRSMAHSKNSGVMSDQGLLPAIKKMAQVITQTNALEVAVEAFGMGDRLENSLELNLFRMVQELVANTIKHAEATKVTIQLTQHEDNLNIIIEDNGKGFDRSEIETDKTGMGLTTIEKRVEHLEGNFTIDSILGKGTSILIDIPV